MRLCDDKETFKLLVERASREYKILEAYVEKDYYAISILKELISRNDKFVFKGGTSLSVCQKAIQRFSEDIDISYEDEIITVGTRKRIKQAFIDSIEASLLSISNLDNIRSRRVFNRYLCPYISLWNSNNDQVIVEWATQTPSFPIEVKTAQTIIGKYLDSVNRHDLVEKYGLEEFAVKTITKERTLIDKIFAICDYHISKKVRRQSRHIYDIYHLLRYVELDDSFIELFKKVKSYRINLETCYSVQSDKPISDYLDELIEEETYKSDYNNITYPLLYDHIKYDEAIIATKQIVDFLKSNSI